MFEIIEKVRCSIEPLPTTRAVETQEVKIVRRPLLTRMVLSGKTKTETLHQSHSLRELHVPSGPRCSWESYAKFGEPLLLSQSMQRPLQGITDIPTGQTNTLRDIQGRDTTEAMNSLISRRRSVSSELCKRLAWMSSIGASMFSVSRSNLLLRL